MDELLRYDISNFLQRYPVNNLIIYYKSSTWYLLAIWFQVPWFKRFIWYVTNLVYTIHDKFFDDVLRCNEIQLTLLSKINLHQLNKNFTAKSSDRVVCGCVWSIDGMHWNINCPTAHRSDGNQRSYHHRKVGLISCYILFVVSYYNTCTSINIF